MLEANHLAADEGRTEIPIQLSWFIHYRRRKQNNDRDRELEELSSALSNVRGIPGCSLDSRVSLSVLAQAPRPDEVINSSWSALNARSLLLWVLLVSVAGTAWVGWAAGWRFFRPYQSGTPTTKCWLDSQTLEEILALALVVS